MQHLVSLDLHALLRRSLKSSAATLNTARLCALAFCLMLPGLAGPHSRAHSANSLEARKLPMTFTWHAARDGACDGDCRGWVAAVGIITGDTPEAFEKFSRTRDLKGVLMVLDSAGGSVVEAISLGRRWRDLDVTTMVGTVIERETRHGAQRDVVAQAYCESMCAFLMLAGRTRTVPEGASVRVHQIWMGDRADHAKTANYTAQDIATIERDIGRLAKYTFEMGGGGELLSLALNVPPWEPLHELTAAELRLTNLVTAPIMANAPKQRPTEVSADLIAKPVQERFAADDPRNAPTRGTKTADALPANAGQ